ncbi:MAG: YidB family protein [Anaeromyxobacter sp.]
MGLLDDLGKVVGAVTGQAAGAGAQAQGLPAALGGVNPQLVSAVIGMLGNGGLQSILSALQNKGLGNVVGSWVGTGQNLPVNPTDLAHALGADRMGQLAQATGLGHGDLAGQLSNLLPGLVDHLTPQGGVPDHSALELGLGALRKFL